MSNKIVYNYGYGSFGLSQKALKILYDLDVGGVEKYDESFEMPIEPGSSIIVLYEYGYINAKLLRHDKNLVKVVEDLGEESFESYANLKIKEIEGDEYIIEEDGGWERVLEPKDIMWVKIKEQ